MSERIIGGIRNSWIHWAGGECPVDRDALVRVQFLDRGEVGGVARDFRWEWIDGGQVADIVAYRLSETQQESGALSEQIGGDHYKQFEIQPVEFINANSLDFLQGSVIKYISRHKLKGKQADVEKAIHFCKLILELQYETAPS